jgi:hypothetical protein
MAIFILSSGIITIARAESKRAFKMLEKGEYDKIDSVAG